MDPAHSSRMGEGIFRTIVTEGVEIILSHYVHFVDKNTERTHKNTPPLYVSFHLCLSMQREHPGIHGASVINRV